MWQKEKGKKTGREHYQCYMEFHKKITTGSVHHIFGNYSFCMGRMGTRVHARKYCMKVETRVEGP